MTDISVCVFLIKGSTELRITQQDDFLKLDLVGHEFLSVCFSIIHSDGIEQVFTVGFGNWGALFKSVEDCTKFKEEYCGNMSGGIAFDNGFLSMWNSIDGSECDSSSSVGIPIDMIKPQLLFLGIIARKLLSDDAAQKLN